MRSALVSLDPGVSTGMAVIHCQTGEILATTVWSPDQVRRDLDILVRTLHLKKFKLAGVVEKMPHVEKMSALGQTLEQVRHDIMTVLVDTYEVPTLIIPPGEWKPSRVARTLELPKKWDGRSLATHQRDAIKMARYAMERYGC